MEGRKGAREGGREGGREEGVNFLFYCMQKQKANVLVKWYRVAGKLYRHRK